MADVLIRNVDDDDLHAIDTIAARQGMSRNEFLRRETHQMVRRHDGESITVADLRVSLSLTSDVLNEDIMRGAWE
ncbi:ribbon-helix-helix protein, CopG family [Flexivirga caeni]|uniref:Ribbon-helix-helix protein, CopG family n=1 Tax=Flexivirga caeni TaxID=2294115 RepID=A0A3M9MHW1_9MICO|nr:ribbon-helix-helix protein, CopG family [Flexivirga caeni]RNI24248.1 ribbon-helix-helix protein, CopG family [Flexivirga caeni]